MLKDLDRRYKEHAKTGDVFLATIKHHSLFGDDSGRLMPLIMKTEISRVTRAPASQQTPMVLEVEVCAVKGVFISSGALHRGVPRELAYLMDMSKIFLHVGISLHFTAGKYANQNTFKYRPSQSMASCNLKRIGVIEEPCCKNLK